MVFEEGERAGVGEGVAGDGYGEIVAAVPALAADLLGDPPDGGVIEEESFDDGLEDADEVVVAVDVGRASWARTASIWVGERLRGSRAG